LLYVHQKHIGYIIGIVIAAITVPLLISITMTENSPLNMTSDSNNLQTFTLTALHVSENQEHNLMSEDNDHDSMIQDHSMMASHKFVLDGIENPDIEIILGEPTIIEFVNTDSMMAHDIAIPQYDLFSDVLESGENAKLEFTAMQVGEFDYLCTLHPDQMYGKIIARVF